MKRSKNAAKIFLTAIALSLAVVLTGCDDYPEVHPKLVDAKRDRYLVHEVANRQQVTFRAVRWETGLKNLNGHYCFSAEELGHLNDWARRRSSSAENLPVE